MALWTCKNLVLGYEGKALVSNISFTRGEGDYLCIVGENGTGKSTLLKTMLGLALAIAGEILLNENTAKTEIGYLPQQTETQKDFPATVEEVVLSGCINKMGLRPFYNEQEKDLAMQNIRKLGIESFVKHSYRELSGGQQQRVLLARALCAASSILVLDEPVAGLDPHMAAELYAIIKKLNAEERLTIVMISHDVQAAMHDATHILHMALPEPLFFGTKEAYAKSSVLNNGKGEGKNASNI